METAWLARFQGTTSDENTLKTQVATFSSIGVANTERVSFRAQPKQNVERMATWVSKTKIAVRTVFKGQQNASKYFEDEFSYTVYEGR